jgi:hypothetical protein
VDAPRAVAAAMVARLHRQRHRRHRGGPA